MSAHLSMEQLIALRDDDRSEPGMGEALQHFAACIHCQWELGRLHQRTARLRALPSLAPATDEFPAVHARVTGARRRQSRAATSIGLAIAATAVFAVITRDIVHPKRLDAEQLLRTEISESQQLEEKLRAWNPEQRVINGGTAIVVIQLENKIADLDAKIAATARVEQPEARVENELMLWRQRVGLMNALVDVHLTKAGNVGL
jgi:hypothetical protein